MFLKHSQISPDSAAGLLSAAEAAARAIPPAFPLEATVAVNPFLGQTGADLATTAARLGRVAGARLTLPRAAFSDRIVAGEIEDADLEAALAACASPLRPADLAALKAAAEQDVPAPKALPTIADLAAEAQGIAWPDVIARSFGLWAAGYFDRGQALWTAEPDQGAFVAWRAWASRDLTPEIAGLTGFCAHVAACPDTPERAMFRAAETLGLDADAAETAFHRLLMDLGGWSQHARWLLWQAELAGGTDATLTDLLAIRLVWEEALWLSARESIAAAWDRTVVEHRRADRAGCRPRWWTRSCRRPPSAPISAGSRACWPHPHRRPRRPGPRCRPPSASTCGRKCSAGRSRASIRGSRRSDSPASSACRWRTGTSPPTSSRPICRCC